MCEFNYYWPLVYTFLSNLHTVDSSLSEIMFVEYLYMYQLD